MPPVNTSASPTDVDNEATAELPVLDVAAYESTLKDPVSHTDTLGCCRPACSRRVRPPATPPRKCRATGDHAARAAPTTSITAARTKCRDALQAAANPPARPPGRQRFRHPHRCPRRLPCPWPRMRRARHRADPGADHAAAFTAAHRRVAHGTGHRRTAHRRAQRTCAHRRCRARRGGCARQCRGRAVARAAGHAPGVSCTRRKNGSPCSARTSRNSKTSCSRARIASRRSSKLGVAAHGKSRPAGEDRSSAAKFSTATP